MALRRDFKVGTLDVRHTLTPVINRESPMPKFACPNCRKSLKTSASVPAGKKIKCPGCSHVFRLPVSTELVEEAAAKRVTVPPDTPRSATRKAVIEAPTDD